MSNISKVTLEGICNCNVHTKALWKSVKYIQGYRKRWTGFETAIT